MLELLLDGSTNDTSGYGRDGVSYSNTYGNIQNQYDSSIANWPYISRKGSPLRIKDCSTFFYKYFGNGDTSTYSFNFWFNDALTDSGDDDFFSGAYEKLPGGYNMEGGVLWPFPYAIQTKAYVSYTIGNEGVIDISTYQGSVDAGAWHFLSIRMTTTQIILDLFDRDGSVATKIRNGISYGHNHEGTVAGRGQTWLGVYETNVHFSRIRVYDRALSNAELLQLWLS